MKTTLLIRADAGGITGTGHVMRMIALAQGYIRRGGSVSMASVSCPERLVERVRSHGITHHTINATQPGDSGDAELTAELAQELGVQWLVVDGYHFDYDYQKHVKQSGLSVLCTDDHGYSDRWHCDAILNQNLGADLRVSYKNDLSDAKVLAGASFCLLREEFLGTQSSKPEWGAIQSLLVTLGGSDPENATEATLSLLNHASERPLKIRVLAGADNPNVERLGSFESQHQIEVVQSATDMSEQYAWADGIISAGGSTCWEWTHLGLPGAIVTIADNQLPIVQALTKSRQAALSLGWFNDSAFGANAKQLSRWIDAPAEVCEAQVAVGIIDGFGADRVASFLYGSKVMVREAKLEDSDQYFVWANNPDVRKNSFSHDQISKDSHAKWFSKRISASDSCLLVVADFEGNDLGQVRFDFDEQKQGWIVDFSIDSSCRGGGYGTTALLEALFWIRQRQQGSLLILAYVLDTNSASKSIFIGLGFKKISSSDSYSSYSIAL